MIQTVRKQTKWLVYASAVIVGAVLTFVGLQAKSESSTLVGGDEVKSMFGEQAFADHPAEDVQTYVGGDDDGGDGGDGGDGTGDDGL